MLEIGTKVFINYVFRRHRPSPTGYEMNLERCYGTVKSLIHDEYYEISVVDKVTGETVCGCFHRYEFVNLGHNEPKYRVGDMVRICDMSEEDKRNYPPGWRDDMGEYIGQTARVKSHVNRDNFYKLEGNDWVWYTSNLKPISEFVGY